MKQYAILSGVALATMLSMSLYSCSSSEDIPEVNNPIETVQPTVRSLNLQGTFKGYADQNGQTAVTRADDSSSWSEGDKIYLQFTNGSSFIPGTAEYTGTGGWTVSYYGFLEEGDSLKCEAYYFDNAEEDVSGVLNLSSYTGIYQDLNASYIISNNELTIVANLSPRLGRIRFTGSENDSIWLTGIITSSKYDPETNQITTSYDILSRVVGSSGSTDYVYGTFNNDTIPTIGLLTPEDAFTRKCAYSVMEAGSTGYMAIPSLTSHNQWNKGLIFTVRGVDFRMIAVPGYSGGRYCIAETETTEELYNKVTDETSTSTSQYPKSSLSYSSVSSFTETLTSWLGITFRVPSGEEWKFAAKGGNRSKGYAYCGSNDIDEVAWYSGNTSSKQIVKQKLPNELGLYDMSGNVSEYSSNWYSSSYYYYYGGDYYHGSSYCSYSSYNGYNYSESWLGFRLAMSY